MVLIKNINGSTLTIVIVFTALLTVMGVALLTTTAAHLKTQKMQEYRKAAFYASESGIDNIAAELTGKVRDLHQTAADSAGDDLKHEIDRLAPDYEAYAYYNNVEKLYRTAAAEPVLPNLYNEDGTVNQDAAYIYAKDRYIEHFSEAFKNWVDGYTDSYGFPVAGRFIKVNGHEAFLNWAYSESPVVGLLMAPEDEVTVRYDAVKGKITCLLPFFSYYHAAEGQSAPKLLTVDIEVNAPGYTAIILDQEVKKFDPNILWTKALTTEGNLLIENGAAEIFGNVYAYGRPRGAKYGIVVGDANRPAVLTVHGEAVTNGDVRFDARGSAFTLHGNLYANSVVVDSELKDISLSLRAGANAFTSYSISGRAVSGLNTAGDMVIKNNLEMRGTGTAVTIEGNFTGFSDPVIDDGSGYVNTDNSCIIINTEKATGDGDNRLNIAKDTVICGIAYLESESAAGRFNTGESIALSGNYNVYKNILTNLPEDGGSHFEDFVKRSYLAGTAVEEDKMLYFNPLGFGLFAPYEYLGTQFSIFNYADYFYHTAKMAKDPWLNSGNRADALGIVDNVNYGDGIVTIRDADSYFSYGVAFAKKGTGGSRSEILPRNITEVALESRKAPASAMYSGQVNTFGDMEDSAFFAADESTRQKIGNQFIFDRAQSTPGRALIDGQENEFVIVNKDAASNIVITGSGDTVKGVIVTKGSVVLDGSLDFRGMIAAEGDIIISGGAGGVTVTNDPDFIAKAMAYYGHSYLLGFEQKDTVWPAYSNKTLTANGGTPLEKTKITRDDFRYVFPSETGTGLVDKYETVKELITIANWKVVEY